MSGFEIDGNYIQHHMMLLNIVMLCGDNFFKTFYQRYLLCEFKIALMYKGTWGKL